MNNNLLSIFPVDGRLGFARVNCIAMAESASHRSSPVICGSREALRAYLGRCFDNTKVDDVLASITGYEAVHLKVTGSEMLRLGLALVSS